MKLGASDIEKKYTYKYKNVSEEFLKDVLYNIVTNKVNRFGCEFYYRNRYFLLNSYKEGKDDFWRRTRVRIGFRGGSIYLASNYIDPNKNIIWSGYVVEEGSYPYKYYHYEYVTRRKHDNVIELIHILLTMSRF